MQSFPIGLQNARESVSLDRARQRPRRRGPTLAHHLSRRAHRRAVPMGHFSRQRNWVRDHWLRSGASRLAHPSRHTAIAYRGSSRRLHYLLRFQRPNSLSHPVRQNSRRLRLRRRFCLGLPWRLLARLGDGASPVTLSVTFMWLESLEETKDSFLGFGVDRGCYVWFQR